LAGLAAICDTNNERKEFFSKKFEVPGYDSVERMLKQEKLDGVTICTPASTHFAIASKTLEAGLHTFVEKPMTTTALEGESLIDLSKKTRRILTVGFIERFNPPISDLKNKIRNKEFGELILLEFHRENRRGENVFDVGIVKDASVHDIDTARWLFAEDPKMVFARVGTVKSDKEDFAAIMLGFGDQRTAFLTSNWVTPKRVRTLTAVFTEGVISVDFVTKEMRIDTQLGTNIPKKSDQEPLMLELKEFMEAIQAKRQPLVTGEDGLKTTMIAEAVLASSHAGTPIFLHR
jgi:UDP-N-acetylglucosamine 3-dehydrogenase